MREIKFRVWDGEEYISLSKALHLDLVGVQHNRSDSYELESFFKSVMLEQYTGLKDKNGKEIYDGDKIKYKNSMEYGEGTVEDCRGGIVIWWDGDKSSTDTIMSMLWYFGCSEELEVIGNIHENPELLEE